MIAGWTFVAVLTVFGSALWLGGRFERQREKAEELQARRGLGTKPPT